eukprot:g17829.t1
MQRTPADFKAVSAENAGISAPWTLYRENYRIVEMSHASRAPRLFLASASLHAPRAGCTARCSGPHSSPSRAATRGLSLTRQTRRADSGKQQAETTPEAANKELQRLAGSLKLLNSHVFIASSSCGSTFRQAQRAEGSSADAFSCWVAKPDVTLPSWLSSSPAQPVKLTLFDTSPDWSRANQASYRDGDCLVFSTEQPRYVSYFSHTSPSPSPSSCSPASTSTASPPPVPTPLTALQIFVCCHTARDKRCGELGPRVLARLQRALRTAPTASAARSAHVWPCSHVGGHRFAGNVVVYPPGDWYGCIRTEEEADQLAQHLRQGRVWWERWRGAPGPPWASTNNAQNIVNSETFGPGHGINIWVARVLVEAQGLILGGNIFGCWESTVIWTQVAVPLLSSLGASRLLNFQAVHFGHHSLPF